MITQNGGDEMSKQVVTTVYCDVCEEKVELLDVIRIKGINICPNCQIHVEAI